mgnify:FL=1
MPGPYVLDGPPTHAFVVAAHPDGYSYRIDAEFPFATITPWVPSPPAPSMLWALDVVDLRPAWACALEHVGRPYDPPEMLAQAIHAPNGRNAIALSGMIPGADICTGLVMDVLASGGRLLDVPDKLPERIARALDAAPWAKRITLP